MQFETFLPVTLQFYSANHLQYLVSGTILASIESLMQWWDVEMELSFREVMGVDDDNLGGSEIFLWTSVHSAL